MSNARKYLAAGLAAVLAVALADAADARRGRSGKADRVKDRLDLTVDPASPLHPRKARLKIDRRSLKKQTLKLTLDDAEPGWDLEVLFEDRDGTFARIAGLAERRPGDYRWRVRTRKGQPLPFGVSDIAQIGGRDVEVRTEGGALVATTTIPLMAPAPPLSASSKAKTAMDVDEEVADSCDSEEELKARIRARSKNAERQELEIEVEHAAADLVLTAWIEDDAGVFHLIGTLERDGDHGEHEEHGAEYELKIRTDKGGVLPLGAASVSELAGLVIEIRLEDGSVLAEGTVPEVENHEEKEREEEEREKEKEREEEEREKEKEREEEEREKDKEREEEEREKEKEREEEEREKDKEREEEEKDKDKEKDEDGEDGDKEKDEDGEDGDKEKDKDEDGEDEKDEKDEGEGDDEDKREGDDN